MKTADDRALDFIHARGLSFGVAAEIAAILREYARDQRHLCAERVQSEFIACGEAVRNPDSFPVGAAIVHCGVVDGSPMLWVRVTRRGVTEDRHFYLAHTGEEMGAEWSYHGTFLLGAGSYVLHLFEKQAA